MSTEALGVIDHPVPSNQLPCCTPPALGRVLWLTRNKKTGNLPEPCFASYYYSLDPTIARRHTPNQIVNATAFPNLSGNVLVEN
jgi:hypothetical protein